MPEPGPSSAGVAAVLPYANSQPALSEIQSRRGALVLDFGTNWCGHCNRAAPMVAAELANQPALAHLKVEDGSGRPLGRAFGVKLWPTLIFLRDGQELARLVRPADASAVKAACEKLLPAPGGAAA